MLRDILDADEQVEAVVRVIAEAAPDVILLLGIDYDLEGHALNALVDRLAAAGIRYPHRFTAPPNTGVPTGRDLDGDGRLGEPEDAQSYGDFRGQGGMALLSRYPIGEVRDFSGLLWADLPGAKLPERDGQPFYDSQTTAVLRLSSVGHWDVPITLPGGATAHVFAMHGASPVFDGPEDRNGLRGRDELLFWQRYLDAQIVEDPPEEGIVLMGSTNIDPVDGEGRHDAIAAILEDGRFSDPAPQSEGGAEAANPAHQGDPARDTADWSDPSPGNLRVDYVLPTTDWQVAGAGVLWPAPGTDMAKTVEAASRHRLVWVDLMLN